eukprot:867384-Rhodomonas_salina.3
MIALARGVVLIRSDLVHLSWSETLVPAAGPNLAEEGQKDAPASEEGKKASGGEEGKSKTEAAKQSAKEETAAGRKKGAETMRLEALSPT